MWKRSRIDTLAWYQVTNSVDAIAGAVTHDGVTVNAPSAEATSFQYNITATAVLQDGSKNGQNAKALLLTTVNETNDGYDTKVWNTAGDLVDYAEYNSNTQALYLVYNVIATGSWAAGASGLTANEKHTLLNGSNETYTLTYTINNTSSDGRSRIAASLTNGLFANEKTPGQGLAYTAKAVSSFVTTSDNDETEDVNEYTGEGVSVSIGTLYVRVEGGKENETKDSADNTSISVVIDGSAVTSLGN